MWGAFDLKGDFLILRFRLTFFKISRSWSPFQDQGNTFIDLNDFSWSGITFTFSYHLDFLQSGDLTFCAFLGDFSGIGSTCYSIKIKQPLSKDLDYVFKDQFSSFKITILKTMSKNTLKTIYVGFKSVTLTSKSCIAPYI